MFKRGYPFIGILRGKHGLVKMNLCLQKETVSFLVEPHTGYADSDVEIPLAEVQNAVRSASELVLLAAGNNRLAECNKV